ncbi:hypothetical protein HYT23_04020 [Candidatus Pacearchaeota archaeon]|nr:hypothetical protein [Candidatus Pacearchaeota archaeon]
MVRIAILLGISTYVSLIITITLAIAMTKFHKPLLKYHKFFAYLPFALATIHLLIVSGII